MNWSNRPDTTCSEPILHRNPGPSAAALGRGGLQWSPWRLYRKWVRRRAFNAVHEVWKRFGHYPALTPDLHPSYPSKNLKRHERILRSRLRELQGVHGSDQDGLLVDVQLMLGVLLCTRAMVKHSPSLARQAQRHVEDAALADQVFNQHASGLGSTLISVLKLLWDNVELCIAAKANAPEACAAGLERAIKRYGAGSPRHRWLLALYADFLSWFPNDCKLPGSPNTTPLIDSWYESLHAFECEHVSEHVSKHVSEDGGAQLVYSCRALGKRKVAVGQFEAAMTLVRDVRSLLESCATTAPKNLLLVEWQLAGYYRRAGKHNECKHLLNSMAQRTLWLASHEPVEDDFFETVEDGGLPPLPPECLDDAVARPMLSAMARNFARDDRLEEAEKFFQQSIKLASTPSDFLSSAVALAAFWSKQGRHEAADAVFALQRTRQQGRGREETCAEECDLLVRRLWFRCQAGGFGNATAYANELADDLTLCADGLSGSCGFGAVWSLMQVAHSLTWVGRIDKARALSLQAITQYDQWPVEFRLPWITLNIQRANILHPHARGAGTSSVTAADPSADGSDAHHAAECLRRLTESLALIEGREKPNRREILDCLSALGTLHFARDEFEEARAFLERALPMSERLRGKARCSPRFIARYLLDSYERLALFSDAMELRAQYPCFDEPNGE